MKKKADKMTRPTKTRSNDEVLKVFHSLNYAKQFYKKVIS